MTSTIRRLVARFEQNVIAQTECFRRGDTRQANIHARRYIRAFDGIRKIGDEGREALAELLKHERDDVQVMAASFLLRYRTDECKKVLKRIAEENHGILSFGASQALERWNDKTWELDPVGSQI